MIPCYFGMVFRRNSRRYACSTFHTLWVRGRRWKGKHPNLYLPQWFSLIKCAVKQYQKAAGQSLTGHAQCRSQSNTTLTFTLGFFSCPSRQKKLLSWIWNDWLGTKINSCADLLGTGPSDNICVKAFSISWIFSTCCQILKKFIDQHKLLFRNEFGFYFSLLRIRKTITYSLTSKFQSAQMSNLKKIYLKLSILSILSFETPMVHCSKMQLFLLRIQ